MTILDYLTNPAGKGSTVLGDQTLIKNRYEEEAQELLSSGKNPIAYFLKKRYLIFYFQLESKSGAKYGGNLHYDILIQLDTKNVKIDEIKPLDLDFQVYSNCPSFLYTYANLFNKKGLIINWSKKLFEKETIRKMANVRNSYGIIGYERSLYITMLLVKMVYGSLTVREVITKSNAINTEDTLIHMIQSQSQMRRSFGDAKSSYAKAKELQSTESAGKKKGDEFSDLSQTSNIIHKTKKVGKIGKVKRSKKI